VGEEEVGGLIFGNNKKSIRQDFDAFFCGVI
jgi:hypothetical protein